MTYAVSTDFAHVGASRARLGKPGGRRQRWVLDDRGRRLLLEGYDGRSETIDRLARQLGAPRWRVKHWASALGLARQKEPRWSEAERDYLSEHLHRQSVAAIARHLGRSVCAVKLQAKRMGVVKSGEGYTLRALELALGVDHHKIQRWVADGWLRGTRRQTERTDVQGGDMWLFTDAAIRELVRRHPQEIDPRRADWLWLVDVLVGLGPLSDPS